MVNKFILKPSYSLIIVLILLHMSAILILILLSTSWKFIVIVGSLCLASLMVTVINAGRWHNKSIMELNYDAPGSWRLINKAGDCWHGQLHRSSIKTPLLVLLNFKRTDSFFKLPVVIPRDALASEEFRRLRVLLLTQR